MIDTVVKKACIRSFVQLVFVCLFCSCENMIEYSPYKAGVKLPYKDLNIKALEQIQRLSKKIRQSLFLFDFLPEKVGYIIDI